MTIRRNSFAGRCCVPGCHAEVTPNTGYLYPKSDAVIESLRGGEAKWLTICASSKCFAVFHGRTATGVDARPALLADGTVTIAETEAVLPFLRAMATLEVVAGSSRWVALRNPGDRPHVLAVAAKLGLDVDPSWREWSMPADVEAMVELARSRGGWNYQLDGVRFLGTRASDDTMKGCLLADPPGLGKTFQVLFSLRDTEALVVVCTKSAASVWPAEIRKWRPDRFDSVRVCEGNGSFAWPTSPRECVIVTYEILPYTRAMIANERARLIGVRDGVAPKPTAKKQADKLGVVGLTTQLRQIDDALARTAPGPGLVFADVDVDVELTCSDIGTRRIDKRGRANAVGCSDVGLAPMRPAEGLVVCERGGPEREADRRKLAELRDEITDKLHRNEIELVHNTKRRVLGKPLVDVAFVLDEVHRAAKAKAKRTIAIRGMATQVRRVVGVTGTPVEDDPFLLSSLLTTCQCNPFDRELLLWGFHAHKLPHGGFEFEREPSSAPGAKGAIKVRPGIPELLRRVMLRRRKEDVLADLPAKVFSEIPVPIDASLLEQLDAVAADEEVRRLVAEGELPPFGKIAQVRQALAAALIPATLALVEEYELQSTPLIVFAEHTAPIEALRKRAGWAVLTGSAVTLSGKPATREQIVSAFQAGKCLGFAGTIASCGESITLTYASRMHFVDFAYSHRLNLQAFDRAHRPGQKECVHISTFVPEHPIARHVAAVLARKSDFAVAVLDSTSDVPLSSTRTLISLLVSELDADASERRAVARARTLGLVLPTVDAIAAATIESDADAAVRAGRLGRAEIATLAGLLPGARGGQPVALASALALLGRA